MENSNNLTPEELDELREYLSAMKELDRKEPEYMFDNGNSAAEWEAWNKKCIELNRKYHDTIKKALLFSLDDMGETAPQSVAAILDALLSDDAPAARTMLTDGLLTARYLPMLNGAAINDIMTFTPKGIKADNFTRNATITTKDGHKITIERFDKLQGPLSTSAKKLLDVAVLYLTSSNFYRSKSSINLTVEIPLIPYGEDCDYQLTPQTMDTQEAQEAENRRVGERVKELKKNIRRDLRDISSVLWSGEETRGRNKGDYKEMRLISSHSISKGIIRINFDIDAASYLVNSYIMQYPKALLKTDNRKPNAYVIGRKIAFHNSNDTNHAAGTECTLSVKSLLAAAPEIPSHEDIKTRGQRNWKDKIKKPLEAALDENIRVGLLSKWEYRDPRTSTTYTATEAQLMTWTQYSLLMVDFVMIDAPAQIERRAARAEAKAKAAVERNMAKKKRGRPKRRSKKGDQKVGKV